jgi:hypothetical protein
MRYFELRVIKPDHVRHVPAAAKPRRPAVERDTIWKSHRRPGPHELQEMRRTPERDCKARVAVLHNSSLGVTGNRRGLDRGPGGRPWPRLPMAVSPQPMTTTHAEAEHSYGEEQAANDDGLE